MRFISQKIIIFLISLLIILSAILLHHYSLSKPIEDACLTILRSALYPFNYLDNKVTNFITTINSINNLQKRNRELEESVAQLKAEITRLKEAEYENRILKEEFMFATKSNYHLLAANIVTKSSESFFQYSIIDKGAKEGVKKGMAVLSQGYLVGEITEVYSHNAKFILINSPDSRIGALIQNSRSSGIVRGELGGRLVMEMIPQNENIKIGDNVCTSGLGEGIPKGIPIGELSEIKSHPNDLFQKAIIASPVDFRKLEIVFVLLQIKQ